MVVKDDEEIPEDWDYPLPPPTASVLADVVPPPPADADLSGEGSRGSDHVADGDRSSGTDGSGPGDDGPAEEQGTDDWGLPTR